MPLCRCSALQSLSVDCVPLVAVCLLSLLTTADAAALNKTGQAPGQILPADQLRPGPSDMKKDVKDDVNESNIGQVQLLLTMEHQCIHFCIDNCLQK